MKVSNPIQQRIDWLAEKWLAATSRATTKAVLIRAGKDEEDMVEAFFDYLLGLDTDLNDIAIHFETPLNDMEAFGAELISELEAYVTQWNNSNKSVDFPFEPIVWKADRAPVPGRNPAALFVKNLNSLAGALELDDDYRLVPVMMMHNNRAALCCKWISYMLEAGLAATIKMGITDSIREPLYDEALRKHGDKIAVVHPRLDMPNAMVQIAAMGDPNDPGTGYRISFMKMCHAISARKKSEVQGHATRCLEIANKHIDRDPYWITQILTVYFALSNDQVGYKDFRKALDYVSKAVVVAHSGEGTLANEMAFRNIGQTHLYRGSLCCQQKEWNKAIQDFEVSASYYGRCDDFIMQIEALRMAGYAAKKGTSSGRAAIYLSAGARLGAKISPAMAEASSYPLLLKDLLKVNYSSQIRAEELDGIVSRLLGDSWRDVIYDLTAVPNL
jgi:tetratricopeptide (TPR) repeat protein